MTAQFLLFFVIQIWGALSVEWNGLRTTHKNRYPENLFKAMPRTMEEAAASNFTFKDAYCPGGTGRPFGPFVGYRYWQNGDPSLILIFDGSSHIAGIQTSVNLTSFTRPTTIPKSSYTPSFSYDGHPYVDDGQFWTLTAYFVDPNIICTGRTEAQWVQQGTGDRLVFQNGTYPTERTNQITAPMTESEVRRQPSWTPGKCFTTMGMHYWYNLTLNMSCRDFFPFFLLYNNGKLDAFGFSFGTPSELPSRRYEHPPANDTSLFMDPVPLCFWNDPSYRSLTTMHVFFRDNARTTSICTKGSSNVAPFHALFLACSITIAFFLPG